MKTILSYNISIIISIILSSLLLATGYSSLSLAAETTKAYELLYDEQEQGTDSYRNRYLITDNFIRIDEPGENSGFILFDHSKSTIYSVNHNDKTILLIKAEAYERPDMSGQVSIEYGPLPDAPKIGGKQVYNYRVVAKGDEARICMNIQLAEALLPEVRKMLYAYQKAIASQQAKILQTTPEEYQTSCFLYDQVYNEGSYYEKGLPIQEWHSNDRRKLLAGYKSIDIDSNLFAVPEGYRQYSID